MPLAPGVLYSRTRAVGSGIGVARFRNRAGSCLGPAVGPYHGPNGAIGSWSRYRVEISPRTALDPARY